MARKKTKDSFENAWILVGSCQGWVLYSRRIQQSIGEPVSVELDGQRVLEREERYGDVVGFYHTHPHMSARPSQRDLNTMNAWVSSFGKALLCVIEGTDGVCGYRFDAQRSNGELIEQTELFPRGIVIGVDRHGW